MLLKAGIWLLVMRVSRLSARFKQSRMFSLSVPADGGAYLRGSHTVFMANSHDVAHELGILMRQAHMQM